MASFQVKRFLRSPYLIALGLLAADQVTKYWAEKALTAGRTIPVAGDILGLSLAHNTGAAFGLFPAASLLLTVLAAAAAVILIIYGCCYADGWLRSAVVGFLLGGAVGNLIDRIRFGYVVDFIASRYWPTFNVADIGITAGAVLLAYSLLKRNL